MPQYMSVNDDDDLQICTECSAVVFDSVTHDQFHERIDKIGETARAADSTAGLFRPLK